MTIECCGSERDGRFCSNCGKRLEPATPGQVFLAYVRGVARRSQATAKGGYAKNPEKAVLAYEKWLCWLELVEAWVKRDEGESDGGAN